jgi:hypothetical protein
MKFACARTRTNFFSTTTSDVMMTAFVTTTPGPGGAANRYPLARRSSTATLTFQQSMSCRAR